MSEEEMLTVRLSKNELALIQYWRESCHLYNALCPLHCIKEGTDFCHLVVEHLKSQIKEQKGS